MKYFIVDAFTEELFKGNPAGVCLVNEDISDSTMQKIAFENNLAETAFLTSKDNKYFLRWFTPDIEFDLCGHATLATAYVVMNYVDSNRTYIEFETKSGVLSVSRHKDLYTMNFPSRVPTPIESNSFLEKALGCKVLETLSSRDLLVLVESEETVANLKIDMNTLASVSNNLTFAVIVTAKGESCDFVSRFFSPNEAIKEDPVTGSAHSTLIPYWSQKLNKTQLVAKQLSSRGGTLWCEFLGNRVNISGKAICYLVGEIMFP